MGKIARSPVAHPDLEAIADCIAKDSAARAAVFLDRLIDYHLEGDAVIIVSIVHGARRWPPT